MIQYTSKPYRILLASQSPRRKELMDMAAMEFEIIKSEVEEVYPEGLEAINVPEYLAEKKADAIQFTSDNDLILTADTVVIIENRIFGKPLDRQDAIDMLMILAGNTHKVITGVCIKTKEKKYIFSEETDVTFYELTEEHVTYYVDNYKPFDKAGSYAIQEWIGVCGIRSINGCFYNVMGLPISRLIRELGEF